jgi:hypothetical protein
MKEEKQAFMKLPGFWRVVKVGLPLQKGLELRAETDTGSGSGATESPARALSAEKTDSGWPPALSDKPSFSGHFSSDAKSTGWLSVKSARECGQRHKINWLAVRKICPRMRA